MLRYLVPLTMCSRQVSDTPHPWIDFTLQYTGLTIFAIISETNLKNNNLMTYNVLWPAVRWPDDRKIEQESLGPDGVAVFTESVEATTDEQWKQADAIISFTDVPPELRPKLENCKIFVTSKVGFDNLDIKAWGKSGIPVCNVPDYGTMEVADHAMALMLSLMKGITFHTRELKQNPVDHWRPMLNPFGRRLSTCTFGIVGLGRIGTATALRAKAFGMDVVCYDPHIENGCELAIGIRRTGSMEELFAQSDIVSVHLPLSIDTRKIINADILRHSKKGLMLINTARGPVIDLDALYDAMRSETVSTAGLDVLATEPADPDHPLIKAWAANEEWINHRLLITPHSAFCTPESMRDMRFKAGEVAIAFLKHNKLQNCVNQQYLAGN